MNLSRIPLESLPTDLLEQFISSAKIELSKRRRAAKTEQRRSFIANFSYSNYEDATDAINAIKKFNYKNNLSLRNIDAKVSSREKYFKSLMRQDWSNEYQCDSPDGDYYVYCHVNPNKRIFNMHENFGGNYGGEPFYIGKGVGGRAYDLKRNQGHGKMIRQLLSGGWDKDDVVHIAFSSLSENKAYEIEAKLIYFFGTIYEKPRKQGILYNLDIPKTPEFKGIMEKIPTRKSAENKLNHG